MDKIEQNNADLDLQELEQIVGGAAQCTYEGKTYSEGAEIKTSSGATQTCRSDGTWF